MLLHIQKNIQKNFKKVLLVVFCLMAFASPFVARAASLSISPAAGSYEVGDTVVVKVVASSSTPFNAVSGVVSIPSSVFSISSVSKAASVLNFWVTEPSMSKSSGTVKFEGVTLGGFTGTSGTVATISLKAVKEGTGAISFKSGQVLANDGQGTDITGPLSGATFTIKPATVKPQPTPVETKPEPEPVKEEPQPAPTLNAPEIMLGTKYGAQAILGTSDYPKAQALISFTAEDGAKVLILGNSDTQGEFNVVVPNSLKRGTYQVTAIMVKEDKSNSEASNTITIVIGNFWSDVGIEIWSLILVLVLLIIYLALRARSHFKDKGMLVVADSKKKEDYSKEENVIHKSFDALRSDVVDRSKGIINEVERTNIEELKKDIDSTEKVISKEIKDIESK